MKVVFIDVDTTGEEGLVMWAPQHKILEIRAITKEGEEFKGADVR